MCGALNGQNQALNGTGRRGCVAALLGLVADVTKGVGNLDGEFRSSFDLYRSPVYMSVRNSPEWPCNLRQDHGYGDLSEHCACAVWGID